MLGEWSVRFDWPGDDVYGYTFDIRNFTVQSTQIPKRTMFPRLSLRPDDVIGLGQPLLINAWITPPPLSGSQNFHDYIFYIKNPEGAVTTIGPIESGMEGTVWFDYTMNMVGTWEITFDWPGGLWENPTTITHTIEVQEEPVPYPYDRIPYPDGDLPRPIPTQNREWLDISGPWKSMWYDSTRASYNPYTLAPKTSHIRWKLGPTEGLGGLTGGWDHGIQSADGGVLNPSEPTINVIMTGRGYYSAGGRLYCIDIHSGEQLFDVPGGVDVGSIRSNDPVVIDIGSRGFTVYDGITGAEELDRDFPTSLSFEFWEDPYVYSLQNYRSYQQSQIYDEVETRLIKWTTEGSTSNFDNRIIWNVSMPWDIFQDGSHTVIHDGKIIGRDFYEQTIQVYRIWAMSTATGEILYETPTRNNLDPDTWIYREGPALGVAEGVLYFGEDVFENEGRGFRGYDTDTGQLKWISPPTGYPWGNFWGYAPVAAGDGQIIHGSYDGLYAFDLETGEINWHLQMLGSGMETPYNQWVFGSAGCVLGGGMAFAVNTEHSPTLYYRGESLIGVDAEDGEMLWRYLAPARPRSLAEGVLTAIDSANGMTYGFTKGPTTTTVSASEAIIVDGGSLLLTGSVLDQSAAQMGTPAISDADMDDWMNYMHAGQPFPEEARGVEVTLDTIDPNGNFVSIGTVTSDVSGNYKKLWQPEHPGEYTIIATFEGSDSYYSSSDRIYLGVTEAPEAPAAPATPPPPPPTETYIAGSTVAILAGIAIAVFLLLRKK
jgi:hypothetical protein